MPLSVEQAVDLIREGARFGDVAHLLPLDYQRDQLRSWYVRAEGVPVNPTRPAPPPTAARKPPAAPVPSGDLCPACGGLMVRTGTCTTCSSCGTSSGGCG